MIDQLSFSRHQMAELIVMFGNNMKRSIVILFSVLAMHVSAEDKAGFTVLPRLETRQEIGPLTLDGIDSKSQLVKVKWPKDYPAHGRRIDGKMPDERLSLSSLNVLLSYISPGYSRDPSEREEFRRIYIDGVQTLLANNRSFWLEVTEPNIAAPTFIVGGVFQLDYWGGVTLQYEMVRCGYAVVNDSNGWPMVEKYRFDFRDQLLRAEGMARAWKLGVWSKAE